MGPPQAPFRAPSRRPSFLFVCVLPPARGVSNGPLQKARARPPDHAEIATLTHFPLLRGLGAGPFGEPFLGHFFLPLIIPSGKLGSKGMPFWGES